MDSNQKSLIASARTEAARLQALHSKFIDGIAKQLQGPQVTQLLRVSAEHNIEATVLGTQLSRLSRLVVSDLQAQAMEYAFVGNRAGIDWVIWRFYLSRDGNLFADPDMKTKICDF